MLNTLTNAEINNIDVPELERRKPEEFRRMRDWLNGRIAKGAKEPFAEVVTLTPVLASLLLERNPINRPLNKSNVMELASDVASDRFVFNGEALIVSDTGKLNDGQHRCEIVAKTGVSIQTVITFGPKEATRFTVDTGRSKSVSNFLAMKGHTYSKILGAAAGYYLQLNKTGSIPYGGQRATKQEILAAVGELSGLESSVEFTSPAMKTVRSHAVVAFCHYLFARKAKAAADEFICRLIDGEGLRRGDPILYCRNRLLGSNRGMHAGSRAEIIIKCWNAWRRGESVHKLILTGSIPKVER